MGKVKLFSSRNFGLFQFFNHITACFERNWKNQNVISIFGELYGIGEKYCNFENNCCFEPSSYGQCGTRTHLTIGIFMNFRQFAGIEYWKLFFFLEF